MLIEVRGLGLIFFFRVYVLQSACMQAAIDNYALGLSASLDTSLGPLPMDGASEADQSWTEWGGLFPTVGYTHNGFFDAVGPMLVRPSIDCLLTD